MNSNKGRRYSVKTNQLNVLISLVEIFEYPDTRSRSLDLLKSKSGFTKWYERHYGFGFQPALIIKKKARDTHRALALISSAVDAAGIREQPTIVCAPSGLSELTFGDALNEAWEEYMIVSCPLSPANYVLVIGEYNEISFSLALWHKLKFSEAWWFENLIHTPYQS